MAPIVTLTGICTHHPELRVAPTGATFCQVIIATGRDWQDRGERTPAAAAYFRVHCWGPLAEAAAQRLHEGDQVVAVGRLDQGIAYQDDGGEVVAEIDIVATDLGVSLHAEAEPPWLAVVLTGINGPGDPA